MIKVKEITEIKYFKKLFKTVMFGCTHCGYYITYHIVAPVFCPTCSKRVPDVGYLMERVNYRLLWHKKPFNKEQGA